MSHERIIGLYEENAAAWDAERGVVLLEGKWLDRVISLLRPNGHVLDIGCGNGEPIARHLAERGFKVTGIDSSPSLVAMCRERYPDQRWLVGDMRSLALGHRFDGILAWHSLFHLPQADQRRMFPRFADHSAPGAPLLFTSGPEAGEAIGEWQGEPLYHASLAPEEYEQLLAENGFELLDRNLEDADCGGASVWLAQMSPASGLDGSA